jgi:hypothetical protein
MNIKKNLSLVFCFFLIFSCNPKRDPVSGKIIRQETNVNKKVENSKGVFSSKIGKNSGTTYEFATSNVLWRATLNSIDFMPLSNVSYSGGLITTDWYNTEKSNESIKISVRFLSDQLSPGSIKVDTFQQICNKNKENCKITKNVNNLNTKIKDQILREARKLKIADEEKQK